MISFNEKYKGEKLMVHIGKRILVDMKRFLIPMLKSLSYSLRGSLKSPHPNYSSTSRVSSSMKIILTGCTGFIGSEVLSQCIRNPSISSIIALSRRSLPETANDPKLKTIIMKDFNSYPDSVLEDLSGADACIW